jgi:hypothetical protein
MKEFYMVKGFKTWDTLGVFGGLVLMALVIIGAFQGAFVDKNVKQAQREAESLGNQIIAGGLKNLPTEGQTGNRAVASIRMASSASSQMTRWGVMRLEGTIGKDPWGQKFNYKIIPDSEKNQVIFMVWSNGPNKKKETTTKSAVAMLPKKTGKLQFSGDDIGNVQIIPL